MSRRLLVLAATTALLLAQFAVPAETVGAPSGVECIAHRGSPTVNTESTAQTFADAIAAGAAELETDVRFTSTGYPYLLHDDHMGVFGAPTVLLANISGTTAVGYTSGSGDHIMSLYELRQMLVANPTVKLQVELKTAPTVAQWAMLANRLDPIRGRTTVTSFSKATVQAAQEHGYRTGLLSSTFDPTTEAPVFIQSYSTLEPDDVAAHASVGVATQVWTIDTLSEWNAASAAGVVAVITNDLVGCLAW